MTAQQFLTSTWGWHPVVIALCVATLGGYARLRRFRFSGRSVFLAAAVAVFFLALASPVAVLADGYLFSAHMLQHLLLQLVVPPLLLLSLGSPEANGLMGRGQGTDNRPLTPSLSPSDGERALFRAGEGKEAGSPSVRRSGPASLPVPPIANAMRKGWLKPVSVVLRRPLITWFLGLGAMWIWHVPTLCSASATNPWVHLVQSVSLLLMGTAFWWPIIGPWRERWLQPLVGVLYLFSACVGCTILGIVLTFAPLGVCPVFMHPVDRLGILPLLQDNWGLDPARDQQLGGLLMWVPPCFVYLCGIFGLFARWYSGPDPELACGGDSKSRVNQPGLSHAQPLGEEA